MSAPDVPIPDVFVLEVFASEADYLARADTQVVCPYMRMKSALTSTISAKALSSLRCG